MNKNTSLLLEEFKAKGGVIKKIPAGHRIYGEDTSYDGRLVKLDPTEYRPGCRRVGINWVHSEALDYNGLITMEES